MQANFFFRWESKSTELQRKKKSDKLALIKLKMSANQKTLLRNEYISHRSRNKYLSRNYFVQILQWGMSYTAVCNCQNSSN